MPRLIATSLAVLGDIPGRSSLFLREKEERTWGTGKVVEGGLKERRERELWLGCNMCRRINE